MQFFRRKWFGAFYRKQPALANILMVMTECWNLGLSSGYILARAFKLFVLSVLFIGRIDTPFLAHGVGWLPGRIPLDGFPISFRKDILIHDAHRHPYMERWAMIYLLKLRHGKSFGSSAGAAWRILFTLALMPWLRRHRVYPKVLTAWTSRHSTTSDNPKSYNDVVACNQQLEMEVSRLRQQLDYYRESQLYEI